SAIRSRSVSKLKCSVCRHRCRAEGVERLGQARGRLDRNIGKRNTSTGDYCLAGLVGFGDRVYGHVRRCRYDFEDFAVDDIENIRLPVRFFPEGRGKTESKFPGGGGKKRKSYVLKRGAVPVVAKQKIFRGKKTPKNFFPQKSGIFFPRKKKPADDRAAG